MRCWRSVAPSGLYFVAMMNGGYTPACNLTVLRTFGLFVCCKLWRVFDLQPGIFTTRRVVAGQWLFMNCLPIKSPRGTAEHRQGCEPLHQWWWLKRTPKGWHAMRCWWSVAPSGLCFVAMMNGGCTPVCYLPVLRTFGLSVCYMLWRVFDLQPGIFTTRRVVAGQWLFMNCLPIKSPRGTAEHRQGCEPLHKWQGLNGTPKGWHVMHCWQSVALSGFKTLCDEQWTLQEWEVKVTSYMRMLLVISRVILFKETSINHPERGEIWITPYVVRWSSEVNRCVPKGRDIENELIEPTIIIYWVIINYYNIDHIT